MSLPSPAPCMWQTLLIDHMLSSPKVQSGIRILNTALLAATTNGLVLSSRRALYAMILILEIKELRLREGK